MTQHTKGPWRAVDQGKGFGFDIVKGWNCPKANPDQKYKIAEMKLNKFSIKENKANARLIAAAPELLEALSGLISKIDFERQVIDVEPDSGCIECTKGTVPNSKNTGLCDYHKARAAIAKAEGSDGRRSR